MTKRLIFSLIFIVILLAACSSGENTANNYNNSATNEISSDDQAEPSNLPAQCTARSAKSEDIARPGDHITGAVDGYAVTLVEYCDFQEPGCIANKPLLALLLDYFPNDIRFIYRHFPSTLHDKSKLATQASEAAGLQGEFWGMYDLLYADVLNEEIPEWSELSPDEFLVWVTAQAEELGLDAEQFSQDLNSEEIIAVADAAIQHAEEIGLLGTPFVVFNGQLTPEYIQNVDHLFFWLDYQMIPLGRLANQQFTECPEITIDPLKKYTATLHTERGDIVIALYPEFAPFAVNSFIFLAENDYYDNSTFHRVIAGQLAQGGDPSGTGMGNPGYLFSIEVTPALKFDRPGLFAMANSGPTANGSQFFISMIANPNWDGGYTIFGEVLEGMDVVESLTARDPSLDPYAPSGDLILDVTIE